MNYIIGDVVKSRGAVSERNPLALYSIQDRGDIMLSQDNESPLATMEDAFDNASMPLPPESKLCFVPLHGKPSRWIALTPEGGAFTFCPEDGVWIAGAGEYEEVARNMPNLRRTPVGDCRDILPECVSARFNRYVRDDSPIGRLYQYACTLPCKCEDGLLCWPCLLRTRAFGGEEFTRRWIETLNCFCDDDTTCLPCQFKEAALKEGIQLRLPSKIERITASPPEVTVEDF